MITEQWRNSGLNTMPSTSKLEIITIPALEDNYYFLIHDPETKRTAVLDAGDADPILAELKARDWTLDEIWITHHHWDHTDGLPALTVATRAPITGASADAHRLPPLARALKPEDSFEFAGHTVHILPADGHTLGQIAYYIPSANALFCADSLMTLGCGRLSEGTPAQMFKAAQRFAALPDETVMYSGHEYASANGAFAITIEPNNAQLQSRIADIATARASGQATVPSTLAVEKATNPYLRVHLPEFKKALAMENASDLEVFTAVRSQKDQFKS
jgi:hydroxyacylglutathione hydrolase